MHSQKSIFMTDYRVTAADDLGLFSLEILQTLNVC